MSPNPPQLVGGYEERDLAEDLVCRIAPCKPCGSPFCSCTREPHIAMIFADTVSDRWMPSQLETDPEQVLESAPESDLAQVHRMAILLGVPWETLTKDFAGVWVAQESCLARTPSRFLHADTDIEGLRNLRAAIVTKQPAIVARFLGVLRVYTDEGHDHYGDYQPD